MKREEIPIFHGTRRLAIQTFLILAMAEVTALAQETGSPISNRRYREILSNSAKLVLSMSLDRAVYFPLEAATLTVTFENPLREAIQILNPLDGRTGGIDLYVLRRTSLPQDSGHWASVIDHPYAERKYYNPSYRLPTRWMSPGERVEAKLSLPPNGCSGLSYIYQCQIYPYPGDYMFRYTYPGVGASVRYQVVLPKVEAETEVLLARATDTQYGASAGPQLQGKPVRIPRYVLGSLVSFDGEYSVLVSLDTVGGPFGSLPNFRFDPNDPRSLNQVNCPCKRVELGRVAVDSFSLSADSAETVTVTYRLSDGKSGVKRLDPTRRQILEDAQ